MDLQITWFLIIAILLTGYAILDGFDLGVGGLHLFVKDDMERRILINSIGPVWDGNEVWLVTGGGALFAAFPVVYASVFSGFYSAFMLLIFAIIFRAVAIDFRSKTENPKWRNSWDWAFSISSIFIALLMGVALGNVINGVPISADYEIEISLFELLNPYSLLVGITTVSIFAMHGSIYLYMKTEGDLQEKVKSWIKPTIYVFVGLYVIVTAITIIQHPHMLENFKTYPYVFIIVILNVLAILNIPRSMHKNRPGWAFFSSCSSIAALLTIFAIGIYPDIVLSNSDSANSLTIYNAASSESTLTTMLYMAIIGMPFVLAYTISIYWVFRGKVKIDSMSY